VYAGKTQNVTVKGGISSSCVLKWFISILATEYVAGFSACFGMANVLKGFVSRAPAIWRPGERLIALLVNSGCAKSGVIY